MLGNVDTKVLMLLSTFALSCPMVPLETMLAEARLLFNKYTLNTISFEIVGIAVGKYDISMSNFPSSDVENTRTTGHVRAG
jgi:hypothetical protein